MRWVCVGDGAGVEACYWSVNGVCECYSVDGVDGLHVVCIAVTVSVGWRPWLGVGATMIVMQSRSFAAAVVVCL